MLRDTWLALLGVVALSCGSVSGTSDASGDTVDASPAACSCVPTPPPNWSGPIALYQGAIGTPPPACPADYPITEHNVGQDLVAGGTCDCACSTPTGVTCGPVDTDQHSTLICNTLNPVPLATFPPAQCVPVTINPNRRFIRASVPSVTGGTCTASPLSNLETPAFQIVNRACGGATVVTTGCEVGEVCAPDPDADFQSRLCIVLAGDNACPTGSPYDQRTLAFGDFTDNRACEGCTCQGAQGTCPGSLQFLDDCTDPPIFVDSVSTGLCAEITNSPGAGSFAPGTPLADCQPSAGTTVNTATETDPVTICCLP